MQGEGNTDLRPALHSPAVVFGWQAFCSLEGRLVHRPSFFPRAFDYKMHSSEVTFEMMLVHEPPAALEARERPLSSVSAFVLPKVAHTAIRLVAN